jgi:RimJ/RimL family protein N-acetyltransferase
MHDHDSAGLIVREAEPADGRALVDTIIAVNRETDFLGDPNEPPPWADQPEAYLAAQRERDDTVFLVASDAGELVGYLGAFVPRAASCRGVVFIFSIGLRASHRGRSIGTRLFVALEDWARARAAWRLELRVDVENAPGLALYRKRGFEIEGRLNFAFRVGDDWREHYWMGKLLDSEHRSQVAAIDLAPPAIRADPRKVEIRPLRAGDAVALLRFEQTALGEAPIFLMAPDEPVTDLARRERELVESLAKPGRLLLVATDPDRQIVGFAGIWREPWTRLAHDATCQVGVLQPWTGCGIAQRLAAPIERWAEDQGLRRLTVALQANNLRGRRFAESRGFHQEVVMRRYARFGDREADRIRLVRLLP